jgi:hypothetical protein
LWQRLVVGSLSAFGHRGVGHHPLPEHAQTIFMHIIKRDPLHAEINDDYLLIDWRNASESATEASFSPKKPVSERTGIHFEACISVNIHTVALS